MAKKRVKKISRKSKIKKSHPVIKNHKKISYRRAILSLIVNIFIPGLGSIIGKKPVEGLWQLLLLIAGIPMIILFIGIPMIVVAWLWGIVTGVRLIRSSR